LLRFYGRLTPKQTVSSKILFAVNTADGFFQLPALAGGTLGDASTVG